MTVDSPQRQLQQACSALDRALRAGQTARAESWLDACPAVACDSDLALELIYAEYVSREAMGAPPPASEYYERFPDLADRLKRLFDVDDLLKPAATHSPDDTTPNTVRPASTAPRRVGPFEILERLGGGGMGVVYRARQAKPRRNVALKLLKAGANAAAQELARFRRESEAIARLQHANIVTVYEVGSDNDQPYLAMEYIPGGDLHAELNGRPQSPEWSAALIATLARAVHYAHEQGVVHRDVKPGNILLQGARGQGPGATSTGQGEAESAESVHVGDADAACLNLAPCPLPLATFTPKLTDFGLATLAGEAGLTRTGQVLGTLAYLAPEQAAATSNAAKPGVDIYALGAVLYECLTGRPPVLAETEAEALRQIQNDEPVAPRKLRPSLSRDLETITLKCLQKSPAQRYGTALALAEDLDRFLKREPILARPVGRVEAAVKWARRKPSQAALVAVSLLAVIGIATLTAVYTQQLRTTLTEVTTQRQRAEKQELATQDALNAEAKRRAETWGALEKLTEQLTEGMRGGPRNLRDQEKQLEGMVKTYEGLAADNGTDAAGRRAAVAARQQMAVIVHHLGRRREAADLYSENIATMRDLIAVEGHPDEFREYLAGIYQSRGNLYFQYNDFQRALADAREAVTLLRSTTGRTSPDSRYKQAIALNVVAVANTRLQQEVEANAAQTEAESLWEQLHRQEPANVKYRHGFSGARQTRAVWLERLNKPVEAEALYRAAMEIRSPGGQAIVDRDSRFNQADGYESLARLSESRGDILQAQSDFLASLKLWDSLAAEWRGNSTYAYRLAQLLRKISYPNREVTAAIDLVPYYQRARLYLSTAAIDANAPTVHSLAQCANNHGDLLYGQSKYSEAFAAFEDSNRALARLDERERLTVNGLKYLSQTQLGAARSLNQLSKFEQALDHWEIYLSVTPKPTAVALLDRAKALAGAGRLDEAVKAALAVEVHNEAILQVKIACVYATHLNFSPMPNVEAEREAMNWIRKAVESGILNNTVYANYLKTSRDWKALWINGEFNQLVKRKL